MRVEKKYKITFTSFVDDLTFTKDNEPGVYRRIPEVLDCWFESGSMPYAQLHYPFEHEEVFKLATNIHAVEHPSRTASQKAWNKVRDQGERPSNWLSKAMTSMTP